MNHPDSFDVIILGGGPAATAAALTLSRYSSLRVCVVEKSNYDTPRIGETLSPGVRGLLSYLGVWDQFIADGHQPSFGTSAAWGSSEIQTRDFILTPFGKGWHLDRQKFDSMLADAVTNAGGTVLRNTRVNNCLRGLASSWQVTVQSGGDRTEIGARFLIDATGKTGSLVRRIGAKRRVMDRLTAIVGIYEPPKVLQPDTFTLIETCEEGWWYSARLPNGSLLAAFMSDADVLRQHGMHSVRNWVEAAAKTRHTSERVAGGHLVRELQTFAAHSTCLERMFGEGWIAAGDAACSHDPLSSSGIPHALDSGIHAARATYDFLKHQSVTGFESYESRLKQSFEAYLATRSVYYKMEMRWPHATFWRRRQQKVTLSPHSVLRSRLQAGRELAREGLTADLAPRQDQLLAELCATSSAAHTVVREFHRRTDRSLPDLRVILALQNMVESGMVDVS